jgi:hypothetical protein
MRLTVKNLDLRFGNYPVGFSARRIWEHTKYGQVNPFSSLAPSLISVAENFIDIVLIGGSTPVISLSGYTLNDLFENSNSKIFERWGVALKRQIRSPAGDEWLHAVRNHLAEHAKQVFVRNKPAPFLETGKDFTLGIAGLDCALPTWLDQNRKNKAEPQQWLNRIKNLETKGLRRDEYNRSRIEKQLQAVHKKVIDGAEVKSLLDYSQLQISILPVLKQSLQHLNFRAVTAEHPLKRIKLKINTEANTRAEWYDAALGYWVDRVSWDDLFGMQEGWIACTHRGQLVYASDHKSGLCGTAREAMELANDHARELYPMLSTVGRWSQFSLTGGENYREWLVTLPFLHHNYFSDHYDLRNILLHIRADFREGPDGESVLFIQEIQSDWGQEARKVGRNRFLTPDPPWLKEWPELALKLLLLHVSKTGASALAWTTGEIQVARWQGLGRKGLLELYDKTLPSALDKILKPYKKRCGTIETFLPDNFFIKPTEDGYEVRNQEGVLMGEADTWKKARELIPCGAQETLIPAHGISLDAVLKKRILSDGFFAWGSGIT